MCQEVKYNYQNIVCRIDRDSIRVVNRAMFTNTAEFECVVTLERDGVKISEPYILERDILRSGESYEYPLTIPKGKVFVMGDNRNDSFDSRDPGLGMVEEKYIMGRAIFRIYPFERVGGLN